MCMSRDVRRWVGGTLIATLTPWITGCYHEVRVPASAPAPLIGKQVKVRLATGAQANVVASDGAHQLVRDVTQMQGTLMPSPPDSLRLGSVKLWYFDRSHSTEYREAAIQVTPDVSATQTKLEPLRTTLFVTGVVFVGMVFVAMAAMAGAMRGILSWGVDPVQPLPAMSGKD